MVIISSSEFRNSQGQYFDMAMNGEDVVIKSRDRGSFKLIPILEDDTLMSKKEFYAKIERSAEQAKQGQVYKMLPNESIEAFLDRILI